MAAAKLLPAIVLAACVAPSEPEPTTLFITDYRANAIYRYDGITGEFAGTFAEGAAQRVDRPASVRLGPNDQLYAAGFGRGEVVRYDVHSGAMMDVFYWDTAFLEEPVELMFHDGELVVLGNDTNNMVVIGMDGRATRTFGYPDIRRAHDFTVDGDNVLVATEPAVQVWDLASGTQRGEIGRGDLAMGMSIATDAHAIYVADWELDRVVAFTRTGALIGTLIDGLDGPIAIDLGPGGDLYVLDATGISRFDTTTGDRLSQLVARDDRLIYPRSFTFVSDAALAR